MKDSAFEQQLASIRRQAEIFSDVRNFDGGQTYTDAHRAYDRYALPDIEIFYYELSDFLWDYEPDSDNPPDDSPFQDSFGDFLGDGWYYWSRFPGCLPDSDTFGPFDTALDALREARDEAGYHLFGGSYHGLA